MAKMAKKGFIYLCVCLIIAVLGIQGMLQAAIQPLPNTELKTETTLGGQYMLFRDYSQTGDFAAYFTSAGSFDSVDKSSTYLKLVKSSGGSYSSGNETRDFTDIAVNSELHNYSLLIRYRVYIQMSGNGYKMISLLFRYTDGSSTIVLSYSTSAYNVVDTGQYWINGTFPNGKTLDFIMGYLGTYVAMCELWVYREIYNGYCPTIDNWTVVNNYIHVNTPTTFSALCWNNSGLQVNFGFESGGTTIMQCFTDWTVLHGWYNMTSFAREGLYDYSYTVYNEWGITTTTPIYLFTVATDLFPKNSYLSLFNTLNGFPLDSKDFKIFLGQPDSRECINFRSFYGTWTPLNYLNIVNASITDNALKMQADHNGLKSPFENGMIYNTTLYNVLQFQVKVFQPTWIVLIYNPALWEKDFYLYIDSAQVGYWLDVTIPFFNFTTYAYVTHDNLYELGVWIENATVLLANIRVAQYYTPTFTISNNQLKALLETNFDLRDYWGIYSFTNDKTMVNPLGWTIYEPTGTSVQVLGEKDVHNLILELTDNHTYQYPRVYNEFPAKTTGKIECWVLTTSTTKWTALRPQSGGTVPIHLAITGNNFVWYSSGGTPHILQAAAANRWYHLRFEWNLSAWSVYIDGTPHLGLTFYQSIGTGITRMWFSTGSIDTGYSLYVDAVDYSWATGYYVNRNCNSTRAAGIMTNNVTIIGRETLQLQPVAWNQKVPDIIIQASADDAYFAPGTGTWYNAQTTLLAKSVGFTFVYKTYLRFPIASENYSAAKLLFYVSSVVAGGTLTIALINKDNCLPFPNGAGNENNYPVTGTYVQNPITTTGWKLLSINTLIQAFVARGGFAPGNYMGLLLGVSMNTEIAMRAFDYGSYISRLANITSFIQYNYTSGVYHSKIYDLGIAQQLYAYRLAFATNSIAISSDILLQYRISYNNITWGAWSVPNGNITINADIARFFQFKVLMKSTDYAVRECYWVNLSYRLINQSITYLVNTYRLCSLQNRQNPNNLIFYDPLETICIQDFYNNTLYYADVAYTPFLDIGIPITMATFYNYENYSAVIRIYRGLGMYLELVVSPHSSVTTELFCTDYRVWIANQHLQQLVIMYLSPNRTGNIITIIGTEKNVTVGESIWTELWDFLLYTPLGNFLIFLICAYLAVQVYGAVRPRGRQVPDHIAHPKVPKSKPKMKTEVYLG